MRPWRCILVIAISALFAASSPTSAQDDGSPPGTDGPPRLTPCPQRVFRAQLLTSVAGTVPRDAALVVGLFPGGSDPDLPSVALTRGRQSVPLSREPIAPGLFRLRPSSARLSGRYDLTGIEGSPNLAFARANLPGPPAQPAVSRFERYVVVSHGTSRSELRAEFDFPIPDGIVAVVAFFGDDDQPDLFARAIPTRPSTVLFSAAGRCSELPDGATEPPHEGSVRVAFVDQFGRISAPSDPRALPAG